jgi:hypothetical protein
MVTAAGNTSAMIDPANPVGVAAENTRRTADVILVPVRHDEVPDAADHEVVQCGDRLSRPLAGIDHDRLAGTCEDDVAGAEADIEEQNIHEMVTRTA